MDTHWFVLICVLSPFGDISLYLEIFCFRILWFGLFCSGTKRSRDETNGIRHQRKHHLFLLPILISVGLYPSAIYIA